MASPFKEAVAFGQAAVAKSVAVAVAAAVAAAVMSMIAIENRHRVDQ